MAVDDEVGVSWAVRVVVLVADDHGQRAGGARGRRPAVGHEDGQSVLLLALAVEGPQGGDGSAAVAEVCQVEAGSVRAEREEADGVGGAVGRGVPVHEIGRAHV